ncbi:hypothetical protein DPV96_06925 [Aggregatibacter segnis]|uniref:Preprotein translocase subunit SecB n=1 Tax=Haemophilus haemolyticus TaxID=726 RepID=A0AAQ1YP22_HAEHA|nr:MULTISPECIES: protein-export chaperone SecB [Pasteurellaceae]RDE66759.1 hypothetical protein DPV96_06925 [Aggregatibacter segnis]TDN44138.1 hypothetical protein EGH31_0187 [Haemophilus haemolyticus]
MSNKSMSLQLKKVSVQEIHLSKSKDELDPKENGFSLGVAIGIPDDSQDSKLFAVTFKSEFQIKEGFILKVEYQSIFESNIPIDKDFKQNKFLTINAPAIAFPFFRAFIATFLTNSGFEPIILPSINFNKLNQKDELDMNE